MMWEQTVTKYTIRLGVMGLFLGVVFLLAYRYCEQAGVHAQKGCILAMIGSLLAGTLSLWPFFRMLKENQETILTGIVWAISIRILLSFSLIALVILFVEVNAKWFLCCYGFFYILFVIMDSWLILLLIRDVVPIKRREVKYDYL